MPEIGPPPLPSSSLFLNHPGRECRRGANVYRRVSSPPSSGWKCKRREKPAEVSGRLGLEMDEMSGFLLTTRRDRCENLKSIILILRYTVWTAPNKPHVNKLILFWVMTALRQILSPVSNDNARPISSARTEEQVYKLLNEASRIVTVKRFRIN